VEVVGGMLVGYEGEGELPTPPRVAAEGGGATRHPVGSWAPPPNAAPHPNRPPAGERPDPPPAAPPPLAIAPGSAEDRKKTSSWWGCPLLSVTGSAG